ncbi:metal-dependent hydrolase [Pseudoalteromonas sp. MMG013]|uniref:metal-dependent hydrolase n=1 Tax=unclassified Pseudoalteromonas TaxID=194690 RepID=UPI001B37C17B|nr:MULTISPECIES: metal-dependent hydrolase [unclassified Pseudoalteromonas]MBQ4845626.1 metal-dependent hydrolase [Pseudoalteromonas sp. MMG005]MBQ4848859.1 metal-dependent hydrolase [Pseudoalteromonas sp. MMG012]MBQ4863446.1 metal-dependent hydrolase [Pseudoalteromonas sp. MMG013]
MANFSTHITASTVSSAMLGTTLLASHIVTMSESFLLILIGALSGLLPDLDADDSTSIGWLFSILGCVLAGGFIATYPLSSLLSVWLCAGGIYGLVWFLVKPIFESITVHRGSLHSILAVLMFTLLGCVCALQLGATLSFSLLVALFVFFGSLVHLLLDECYSVDLANNRIKSSFGSAMKIIDIRYPFIALSQLGLVGAGYYYLYQHYTQIPTVVVNWYEKLMQLTIVPSF